MYIRRRWSSAAGSTPGGKRSTYHSSIIIVIIIISSSIFVIISIISSGSSSSGGGGGGGSSSRSGGPVRCRRKGALGVDILLLLILRTFTPRKNSSKLWGQMTKALKRRAASTCYVTPSWPYGAGHGAHGRGERAHRGGPLLGAHHRVPLPAALSMPIIIITISIIITIIIIMIIIITIIY